jgi:hypothetical protein
MLFVKGASVCYTQMFDSSRFVTDIDYRSSLFHSCVNDRPLIVQFAANDSAILKQAIQLVQPYCDGQANNTHKQMRNQIKDDEYIHIMFSFLLFFHSLSLSLSFLLHRH